jgi:hypothetical protein
MGEHNSHRPTPSPTQYLESIEACIMERRQPRTQSARCKDHDQQLHATKKAAHANRMANAFTYNTLLRQLSVILLLAHEHL